MRKPTRRMLLIGVIAALVLPVLAQAPKALTVIVNGFAVQGKALWYKGKIYVPLEDLAQSTGGTYTYNAASGTAQATVGVQGAAAAPTKASGSERPYLKVVYSRKYTTGNNAKVLATILNEGQKPAGNIEVICTFKDGQQRELTSVVQNAGNLAPGESRTLEFELVAGSSPVSPGFGQEDHVFLGGHWTRISYALKFNYQ